MGWGQRFLTATMAAAVGGTGLVATAGPAAAAALRVSPATGLDPGGQTTVSVAGSGFDPERNNRFGVYVVFGPRRADFHRDADAFGAAVWVHPGGSGGGQAPMSPSGTFSVTLSVKAKYTDGHGRSVDCTATRCYVMAMAAHGVADRSQDVVVPITFKGPGARPSGPGSNPNGPSPSTSASGGSGAAGGSTGAPTPTVAPGATPQAAPAASATPLVVQPFRLTASGPPAQSPWPFWLAVGAVVIAALTTRHLARRRP